MEISEIVTEEVEKMCEAFCDAEPAVCVLLRQLGVADNDVQEVLFGTDSSTYGRCLAEGIECVATDAAYAAAIDLARLKTLTRWVRETLASIKLPHLEEVQDDRATFSLEFDDSNVHVVIDRDGVTAWSFPRPALPESSDVHRFISETNMKYAMLGQFVVKCSRLAYCHKPHIPALIENRVDEVATATVYGSRVLEAVRPAINLLRNGVSATLAIQLIPAKLVK